ncbi:MULTISPECIES: tyrosine-type recombinase/integrase [Oceanospirillaceae]|jgi:integrase|uniref:Site-specific integrase n=1 Tax=Oceanobacter antarcticus TaxID=3133425 RepID=A0ABW8NHS4_9GAMM|tara:strand:- start:10 stop:921 length:912 start_codon:yes stop_codon:yes gene_type:complete
MSKPPISSPALPTSGQKLLALTNQETLQQYLSQATSDNTRKAYRSAVRQFEKWGGRLPASKDAVIQYLLARAQTLNPRTLNLHLTAISQWHLHQGVADPTHDPLIRKTMTGIRRTHGKPQQKAHALRLEHIAKMIRWLDQQPEPLTPARDAALVLTGFFGAFRRSELVAIRVEDLQWEPEGLVVALPRSKTDQQGRGLYRAIPFGPDSCCPVRSLRRWLAVSGIQSGPVFRAINRWGQLQPGALNPASVNELLKKLGQRCQFDFAAELSGHSFRRGLSTSAARENVEVRPVKALNLATSSLTY